MTHVNHRSETQDFLNRLIELAIRIQQVPAPTFHERERAELVRSLFTAEGLEGVEIDAAGNVLGCLKGQAAPSMSRPVVVSAHLDTVFPPNVELTIRREADRLYGPGIGDNSLGVAGLLGLAWRLRANGIVLPFDLWLVANVCEEGLGDLKGMKALVERFGKQAGAYIILEGMSLGSLYHRGLGVRRYSIGVKTAGGHSWNDYGKPSAIHELTGLSSRITRLEVPQAPRTTLNIGVITGGTTVNSIAAQAAMELDLRSESPGALEQLALRVEQLCQQAGKPGVEVICEVIGARPAGEIPEDHPLVNLAAEALRTQELEPRLAIGSTDANIPLSRGLSALALGLTTGSGGHTVHEYIHLEPLEKGMEALVKLVRGMEKIQQEISHSWDY